MSQTKFDLVVPSSFLPNAKVRVFKYIGSTAELDIYQKYRAICSSINIINSDASNSVSISIDNEPTFTLLAGDRMDLLNIQISKLNITGTGNAQFILSLIPETLYNAVNKKLAVVD